MTVKKLAPGTRVARSLDKKQAEQFIAANRQAIGDMVIRVERPPADAPPSIKRIWSIYTK